MYGPCRSHYLSTPALILGAILNKTKIELEFISDADMYLFFEKEERGGVSNISKIISKNKYIKSYDPKPKSQYIIYLEVNNLNDYVNNLNDYAMSKSFPTSQFKRIDPRDLIQINTLVIDRPKGVF